jgi:hypothetical protein
MLHANCVCSALGGSSSAKVLGMEVGGPLGLDVADRVSRLRTISLYEVGWFALLLVSF